MMSPSESPLRWLTGLTRASANLPQEQPPRPYYSQRESSSTGAPRSSLPTIVSEVCSLVREFHDAHYFAETLGFECAGDSDDSESSPERELEHRVGKPHLWSVEAEAWTEPDLCDFIEVFHDLAARPTRRWFHSFADCGWHPEAFSQRSGRALYRWRMNRLLDTTALEFQLAETGEDTGRMVRRVPGELGRLVEDTLSKHGSADDPVAHAIALFRDRDGTRQSCRSAVVALASVLEERRKLLKDRLLTNDEKALFEIANQFDIRHRRADQYRDYAQEYLDWIFYWYLATVQLTDRLLKDSTH